MGKEYVEQFHAIYPDLAAQYDVLLYPFFLEGAALHDGLMQADGIHPNGKGVAVIVENMMPKVEELIAQAQAKGGVIRRVHRVRIGPLPEAGRRTIVEAFQDFLATNLSE